MSVTEQALAKLRHHRVKASEAVVAKALEGDWRPEHLLVLQLAWENWQHLQQQIGRCDEQLSRLHPPVRSRHGGQHPTPGTAR